MRPRVTCLAAVASAVGACGLFVWTAGPVAVADASTVSPESSRPPQAATPVRATYVPVIPGAQKVFLVEDFSETVPTVTPSNQSSCRGDLPGAVMTITMADIAYSCPVYAGGQ